MTPQQLGFQLEDRIDKLFRSYNIRCYREKDIQQKYNCTGIDHILEHNGKRVYIQAKWEEKSPNIRDISHLYAEIQIVEKTKKYPSLYIFASKKSPTKRGYEKFAEHKINSIYNDDMNLLLRQLEQTICKFFNIPIKESGMEDNGWPLIVMILLMPIWILLGELWLATRFIILPFKFIKYIMCSKTQRKRNGVGICRRIGRYIWSICVKSLKKI